MPKIEVMVSAYQKAEEKFNKCLEQLLELETNGATDREIREQRTQLRLIRGDLVYITDDILEYFDK